MPCPARQPTNQPTDRPKTGVHVFYTNAQTNTPYPARLQKEIKLKIKSMQSRTSACAVRSEAAIWSGATCHVQVHGAGIW